MGQNSIISSFFARRAKKALRSSPQELEVGPRSGPYLLVPSKLRTAFNFTHLGRRAGRQAASTISWQISSIIYLFFYRSSPQAQMVTVNREMTIHNRLSYPIPSCPSRKGPASFMTKYHYMDSEAFQIYKKARKGVTTLRSEGGER